MNMRDKEIKNMRDKELCVVSGHSSRCHNLKNGNEASEVTEGKSSRKHWGR